MSEPAPGRIPARWHGLGLRWRLLLIGVAGLTVGLALGGVLLTVALEVAFDRSVDQGADQTAGDVAQLIAAGPLPDPLLVAGGQLVQVVNAQDQVQVASPGVDRPQRILAPAELALARSGRTLEISGAGAGLDGSLRVLATSAGPASNRLSVIVAVPLGDSSRVIRALKLALLVLFAPLVLGLAAIAWWVIGRTLRPVEALRASAEEITGQAGTGDRLPVPAGEDEIRRLALTLNGMLDRLEAGRRRQRQFVADAAHELRNPLAGMRTQLEVAQRHPAGQDWTELTEDLLVDTRRLATLADDLLLLAGVDEASAATRRATAAPIPVREALGALTSRYRDARVEVALSDGEGEDPGGLVADPDDFRRLMTNLVDNAVRYARARVWLGAQAQQDQVLVTVTDDGPGIPESAREQVFERFTRLDDARAVDDGGAGLGLAIVAELVRRHGGTIRLRDADPGKPAPGLRVEVLMPRDRSPSPR